MRIDRPPSRPNCWFHVVGVLWWQLQRKGVLSSCMKTLLSVQPEQDYMSLWEPCRAMANSHFFGWQMSKINVRSCGKTHGSFVMPDFKSLMVLVFFPQVNLKSLLLSLWIADRLGKTFLKNSLCSLWFRTRQLSTCRCEVGFISPSELWACVVGFLRGPPEKKREDQYWSDIMAELG